MKPTLYRERSREVLQVPTSAGTLMITGMWARTLTGSRFLLKNYRNSGTVFATEQFLQLSTETAIIVTDGTFNACPYPFEQLYVNFGTFDERKIPLIFSFLEGKTTQDRTPFLYYQAKNGPKVQYSPKGFRKKYFRF